jgi:tRNA nucleotidyltransferase (CCA-adding enzyme)
MKVKFYLVGGAVRDRFLGFKSKDKDYAVEADSYADMIQEIKNRGGQIFLEKPEYATARATMPTLGCADYVLCRKDGYYSDGRRPDSVAPGTLLDDLSRRDFTVNAMAIDEDNNLIDPFFGKVDLLELQMLRCVGDAEDRFKEDSLRMLRAIRFAITKRLSFHDDIYSALSNPNMVKLLDNVSIERIREELYRCFYFDTPLTLRMITQTFPYIGMNILNTDKLWLEPTLKERPHLK